MKQETGSNTPQSTKKVSIQLSLDGHSFSAPALTGPFSGEDPVMVEVLAPQTMLVPVELFDADRAAELLSINGMPVTADQCVVCTAPQQENIAIIALPTEAMRQVEEQLGSRAHYTTPLLVTPQQTAESVWIHQTPELLYIKVYNQTLRLAEVIAVSSDADILYFIDRLGAEFPLAGYRLQVTGERTKSLVKLLKQRFK